MGCELRAAWFNITVTNISRRVALKKSWDHVQLDQARVIQVSVENVVVLRVTDVATIRFIHLTLKKHKSIIVRGIKRREITPNHCDVRLTSLILGNG